MKKMDDILNYYENSLDLLEPPQRVSEAPRGTDPSVRAPLSAMALLLEPLGENSGSSEWR